jgi:hypothetical protein
MKAIHIELRTWYNLNSQEWFFFNIRDHNNTTNHDKINQVRKTKHPLPVNLTFGPPSLQLLKNAKSCFINLHYTYPATLAKKTIEKNKIRDVWKPKNKEANKT